jgi:uncharacterized protein (DUF488 family)
MAQNAPARLTVYTLGHSNHTPEHFVELLKAHAIGVLADVRSSPYSKYAVDYNAEALKRTLGAHGFQYLFLGQELGGRPPEPEYYDEEGYVRYDRVAASERFQDGLERLLKSLARSRVALLCSEEDPASCHRRLLVSRVLAERGVEVLHIRGDSRLQTEAEVREDEAPAGERGQGLLFEVQETPPWRSAQSVSPGRGPGSSSEP